MASNIDVTLLDCGNVSITLDQDLTPDQAIRLSRRAGALINKYRNPVPTTPGYTSHEGGSFTMGFGPAEGDITA